AAHLAGPLPLLALRLPVLLQRSPNRLPVLRGRFHDYFFDLLLVQPLGQHMQFTGGSAELAPLKPILTFPGDVGHHDRQHLLVNVYCCDSIRHHASPWRSGEHAKRYSQAGAQAIAAPVRETSDAQLFAQSAHAPDQTGSRPRLLHCPTDLTASTFAMMPVFHEVSRAAGPSQQGRKTPRPHARAPAGSGPPSTR